MKPAPASGDPRRQWPRSSTLVGSGRAVRARFSQPVPPGPPPAISSDLYVEEFEEVRDYGVNVGLLRTAKQTETARFFTDVTIGPLHAGLRDLVTRRELDISDSARLFAAVDVSVADAAIAVWDGKFHYGQAPDHRDPRGRY